MNLVVNLKSNCEFWQLKEHHKKFLENSLKNFDVMYFTEDEDLNLEKLKKADFYYGWEFKEEWISVATNLKMIIIPSAGKDYMPLDALQQALIPVITGTGYHSIPMVEQIMAYILGFSRGIFQTYGLQKKKEWWKADVSKNFFDLNKSKMAIIGCGAVGKKLAKTALNFGITSYGIRRNINQMEDYIIWEKPENIKRVLKDSDIIVNLLPLNEETEKKFNKELFDSIGHCKIFINIGRGQTVVEKDLEEALNKGIIDYCALDVFDPKPPKMDNPLRYNPKVLMTPKTGVFFHQYVDYAIKYLIVVLKQYFNIIEGMNLNYAKKEYVYKAIIKYFNSDRMNNLIDFEAEDLINKTKIIDKCNLSKNEIIERYKATNRNWPFIAFTINSMCNRNCLFCDAKNEEKDLLSIEEYKKIAIVANEWEISKIHFSGGEPTLRKNLVKIVSIFNKYITSPNKQIGITTNGSCSYELIDQLIDAGMTNFNFSLHSLDKKNIKKIMGTGDPEDVVNKIKYCLDKNVKVKVNCTLMRTYVNDALQMLTLAKKFPIDLRFVELQEIGPAKKFFAKEFISEDEFLSNEYVKQILKNVSGEKERKKMGVRSPGKYYIINGWKGTFAFISNTSMPVCADGNRIKITPTGRLRPCTLENCDLNLRDYLVANNEDEAFRKVFFAILNRESNPCHRGFHFIDYDLRWDNYKFTTNN